MATEGLGNFAAIGQSLLDGQDAVEAHSQFNRWVREVSDWLDEHYPDSGLSADWAAQGHSYLVMGRAYYDSPRVWALFRMQVEARLRWIGDLPRNVQLSKLLTPVLAHNEAKQSNQDEIKLHTASRAYINPDRLSELEAISNSHFDLAKLICLCEEINICFAGGCYLAIIILTRSLLDHVAPIFRCQSFSEVANNYAGTRSFKEAMHNLDTSSRNIANHYLHGQVRSAESLPNITQIDFSNNIDVLLAEVARLLK